MASMFTNPSGELSRDGIVSIIVQTQEQVKHLTEAMKDLKTSIEELADRFDKDTDELRGSMAIIGQLRSAQESQAKELSELKAARVEDAKRITSLETWRTQEKAWMAALGFVSGILGSAVSFVWANWHSVKP